MKTHQPMYVLIRVLPVRMNRLLATRIKLNRYSSFFLLFSQKRIPFVFSCFLPWTIKHPKIGPIILLLLGEQILFDSIAKGDKYNGRAVSSESIHIHLIYCIAKSEDFDQTTVKCRY